MGFEINMRYEKLFEILVGRGYDILFCYADVNNIWVGQM